MIDEACSCEGSEEMWQRLEAKLRPFVRRRVSEADVDDVLQEIYLRIQRGLPDLREGSRFGPWVYQLARNAIADQGRSAARHPLPRREVTEAAHDPAATAADDLDEQAVQQEVAFYAALFVSALPSPYREALTLTELQGLTQGEAAEMLGISLSGMKSRVQRGRVKLRGALEDCCAIGLDARHRVVACEPRADGKFPDGSAVTVASLASLSGSSTK